jgi:hypothetical protein
LVQKIDKLSSIYFQENGQSLGYDPFEFDRKSKILFECIIFLHGAVIALNSMILFLIGWLDQAKVQYNASDNPVKLELVSLLPKFRIYLIVQ